MDGHDGALGAQQALVQALQPEAQLLQMQPPKYPQLQRAKRSHLVPYRQSFAKAHPPRLSKTTEEKVQQLLS